MKKELIIFTIINVLLSMSAIIHYPGIIEEPVCPPVIECEDIVPLTFSDEVFILVNNFRKENDLSELVRSDYLDNSAKLKANDMVNRNYFDHEGPNGESPWYFMYNPGNMYESVGENLSKDFDSALDAHDALIGSYKHRIIMLNGDFTEIGIGINNNILVQHFGARR